MPSDRISHTEITENLLSTEHTLSSLLHKFEPVRRSSLKFFPEARYSSALSIEIFVKNFICCLPELQIISCRRQYLKQDFSKDFQPSGYPKKSTDHTEDTEKDFRRMIKTTPSDFKPQTSDFIFALQLTVSKSDFFAVQITNNR